MKNIKKCIVFDGFKFWYRDQVICDAPPEIVMMTDIPKELLDNVKMTILGKVCECKLEVD